MNKNDRFQHLLGSYVSGNISADDHDELLDLLATHKYDALLAGSIQKDLEQPSKSAADLPPHIAEEIVRNIFSAEKSTAKVLPIRPSRNYIKWMVAASIAIIISVGGYFLIQKTRTGDNSYSFAALIPDSMITKVNASHSQEVFKMADGSTVRMEPNSILHYARNFDADKREVFLEGEAFFQVAKNPGKPFLVYYNNIVTKVLGTSFRVNTNAQTGNVEVSVKTGRVQVYENAKLLKDSRNIPVILTPNQKVIYKTQDRLFETSLVEEPQPIMANETENIVLPFVYDQEKMVDIFKHIEANYGIEIVVENTNINNCSFTGDVSGQNLYTKLKIICLTMNATYEINGTKILIKGNGCNDNK
ncbi:MAG: FecR family protein [Chitinophagaceae bacterium]